MSEEVSKYLDGKVASLSELGYVITTAQLSSFYETLRAMRDDEAIVHIDRTIDRVMQNLRKQKLNELAKSGQYDSMEKIRDVVFTFIDVGLSDLIEIYGGSVPYFLTERIPKRMIEDIDLHVSLEDMGKVRAIIKSHPELFEVVVDTKDEMCEDFGMEIRVDGTDVSLFPTIYTEDGRITRNFEYSNVTNVIRAKETLFYGLDESNATIPCMIGGHEISVETPEIIYCQKKVAEREKDKIDLEVLDEIVSYDNVSYYSQLMQTPKRVREFDIERGRYISIEEYQSDVNVSADIKSSNDSMKVIK